MNAVKTATKTVTKTVVKTPVKTGVKTTAKTAPTTAPKTTAKTAATTAPKTTAKTTATTATKTIIKPAQKKVTRTGTKAHGGKALATDRPRPYKKTKKDSHAGKRAHYAFMRDPGLEHNFDVGDTVEVYCDHERGAERVRGWLKGIVVQVDNNKMVAVQFRSNVYLTDGWMVPDKILWYPVTSAHIRPAGTQKKLGSKEILEY
jgi:hypothetical protein